MSVEAAQSSLLTRRLMTENGLPPERLANGGRFNERCAIPGSLELVRTN